MDGHITRLMEYMVDGNASDMYITPGVPIMLRINDDLKPVEQYGVMSGETVTRIMESLLSDRQLAEFKTFHEVNMSFGLYGLGRFRVNVLQQRQVPSLVIRAIKKDIPAFETLGLPTHVRDTVMNKRGIIILCGMTGSGKSTTLASMLDYRNATTTGNIITIEDPIEYLYEHKKSLVLQREVGIDTESYHIALKNAFRQKPDVILIGEIRDRPVMEQALVAAETGHLCLSTIHANNTYQAIERIMNFFDETQMNQARMNLAMNLRAIIAQRLVTGKDGKYVLVYEILLNEGYIRELILKGETNKIREVIAQNASNGMITFDQCLQALYEQGRIGEEVAVAEADSPVNMELLIRKLKIAPSFGATKAVKENY
jgi:twitching motility protein PilU